MDAVGRVGKHQRQNQEKWSEPAVLAWETGLMEGQWQPFEVQEEALEGE